MDFFSSLCSVRVLGMYVEEEEKSQGSNVD